MTTHRFIWTPAAGWNPPLDSSRPALDLVLYFGGSGALGAESGPLAELLRLRPAPIIAGCGSAGAVLDSAIHDDALVVVGLRFDSVTVRAAAGRLARSEESSALGEDLGRRLAEPGLRHVLLLSDGVLVNGSGLAAGLRRALPAAVTVTGGLAGDGNRFRRTEVGLGDDVGPGRVVAIGFYGSALRVDFGVGGGWTPFGPLRQVTRSAGPVVWTLDDEPALSLYRRYLGERAADLPGAGLFFPLQILPDDPGRPGLIRTLVGIDDVQQSVTFAGDLPQGARVRFMRATRDALINGAETGLDVLRAGAAHAAGGSLALVVSCVGRRAVLGQRCEEELELARGALPADALMAGFYSYGEIAPAGVLVPCELHNQTFVLTLLGEQSA